MDSSVPLWAFVGLGLAAPLVALFSVLLTIGAESRRSHRDWLRHTKFEAYDALFGTFHALTQTYSRYLDLPTVTPEKVTELNDTAQRFKDQYERTMLVASMRVSLSMERELFPTWLDVYIAVEDAVVGEPPANPRRDAFGDLGETRRAVRYDLGVRRDPDLFGKWRDRDYVVRG
ncbi:hypothetical protein [Gordonia sp. NPDC058843]|uniref:hypothetical protein n=1 Tax=Gordonia sp. NPDC058843 TaxID=3346648 RepID=UPI0036C9C47B